MKVATIALLFASLAKPAEARSRKIELTSDEVASVRTALGIATIIQVPDRPNSLIVGDQDAFKVEYLDRAITIKPLHADARSNLYIYTDYRRFNVQLFTVAEPTADYVVYLESEQEKKQSGSASVTWMKYEAGQTNDGLTFDVLRLGRSADGLLQIEFTLRGRIPIRVDPAWFWLTQKGETRPIQNLILSSLELSPNEKIKGMIQLVTSELDSKSPLHIELRRRKRSSLQLPKVSAWR